MEMSGMVSWLLGDVCKDIPRNPNQMAMGHDADHADIVVTSMVP